jgi:hypothetical protein
MGTSLSVSFTLSLSPSLPVSLSLSLSLSVICLAQEMNTHFNPNSHYDMSRSPGTQTKKVLVLNLQNCKLNKPLFTSQEVCIRYFDALMESWLIQLYSYSSTIPI